MKKKLLFIPLLFLSVFCSITCAQSEADYLRVQKDLAIFDGALGLKLKKKVNKKSIAAISNPAIREVATSILAKQYKPTYKFATYNAILNPRTLGRDLSIGDGYSKYENITGVYLEQGEHVVLVDGIENGKEVKLYVPNWLRKAPNPENPTEDSNGWGLHKVEFTLKNGVNIINLKKYGSLAYIAYFSDTPEKENPIKVHFITGKENGYFDIAKDKNSDWDALIENAVFPILDARGKHIQTAYPVEALKKYASGRGVELISNYDSLVYRQHRLMGLIKYNKVPKNRILSRVNYNYYMFRDGDGVAYMGDKVGYAMRMVVSPDVVIKGDPCWGFSHEVGHVHQTRPMFNWGGLGEVSNNLFSLYVLRSFGNTSRIASQNNFELARKKIIDGGISYLADDDVFNRLVPFWQLQLYFEDAGKNADFYPDLFEAFRKQEATHASSQTGDWATDRRRGERNPAVHQLNFVKTACEISKVDLTEFFAKYGFFYVGTLNYDDYGKYTYTMTQEMVDKCLNEIKALNLPKPILDISTMRDPN